MKRNAEQTPCTYDLILRCIFIEIFEARKRFGHFLDFIKYQQHIVGINFVPCIEFKSYNNALNIEITFKQIFHSFIVIKIDIYILCVEF